MDAEFGKRPLRHHSFILTVWQEAEAAAEQPPVWRFRLEDPHSQKRWGFTNAAELARHLHDWLATPPEETPAHE